jgi:TPR repeat protein
MKPLILDDSPCQRSHSRLVFSRVLALLVLVPCFSLTWSNSPWQAAAEETSKAVRRGSPEAGSAIRDQRRVALVIGNGSYGVGPLRNPAHDAEDLSSVLQTLGFAVQTKINVNLREMEEAINRFVREIQNGDVALFYFSGHGVQVKGENYLIPLGDSITSEADVRYKTVNIGLVLGKMEESRNRANIVILDACRNNPFKGLFRSPSMGLSKMDAPIGTFIAYATSPDSVAADGTGRNSPYTRHLIEALKVKDIPIELAFKRVARAVYRETGGQQTPWISSSLLDDFYCNPSSPTRPQEASLPPSTSPVPVSGMSSEHRKKAERLAGLIVARGDASAREELYRMYKDPEAVKWFRQAAERGDAVAQLWLGRMFYLGLEVAKDYPEAVKWYRKAADQGNSTAQYDLGNMYRRGCGVAKDDSEAVKWFGKSADQGNAMGQCNLAWMYLNGVGVPKDYPEALKWYKRAAEQGYPMAQVNLGKIYENGYGVPKDFGAARKWYRQAADQGNAFGQRNLGRMYKDGRGVPKDLAEAAKWYGKAADQGDATGQAYLGWMYAHGKGVPQDYEEALKWYRQGVDQGNAFAQNGLGEMYCYGHGVSKDYSEAVKWYKKAVEQGNPHAQANLGYMYKNGYGVPKDRTEAVKWYRKAAERGNGFAKKELRKMGVAVK